jgi:hypothetical protein
MSFYSDFTPVFENEFMPAQLSVELKKKSLYNFSFILNLRRTLKNDFVLEEDLPLFSEFLLVLIFFE